MRVLHDHPSLAGHFPGRPIVPGVVLLDCVIAGLETASGRRVVRIDQAKFLAALQPGEGATAHCEVERNFAAFRIATRRDDQDVTLTVGRLALYPNET